jgi:hypothetical protein
MARKTLNSFLKTKELCKIEVFPQYLENILYIQTRLHVLLFQNNVATDLIFNLDKGKKS